MFSIHHPHCISNSSGPFTPSGIYVKRPANPDCITCTTLIKKGMVMWEMECYGETLPPPSTEGPRPRGEGTTQVMWCHGGVALHWTPRRKGAGRRPRPGHILEAGRLDCGIAVVGGLEDDRPVFPIATPTNRATASSFADAAARSGREDGLDQRGERGGGRWPRRHQIVGRLAATSISHRCKEREQGLSDARRAEGERWRQRERGL